MGGNDLDRRPVFDDDDADLSLGAREQLVASGRRMLVVGLLVTGAGCVIAIVTLGAGLGIAGIGVGITIRGWLKQRGAGPVVELDDT